MRLIVCGGRDYADWRTLFAELDALDAEHVIDIVIEGGQRTWDKTKKKIIGGADYFAYRWAQLRGVKWDTMAADWDAFGNAAGPLRNGKMIEVWRPQLVMAARGGRGTRNMMRQALEMGIEVKKVG